MKRFLAALTLSLLPAVGAAQDWLGLEKDLAALYLPTGVVNGEIDEQTYDAIKLFQYSFGFPMKNRLTELERTVLARAAVAAQSTGPFVFEEEREVWDDPETLFLTGYFDRFTRRVFANGPHFMAERTLLPYHPDNVGDPNNLFTTNTERVSAYADQAEAIAANAGAPLAPSVFILTQTQREDPNGIQLTLKALETILPLAEKNPAETAMTALMTQMSRGRFRDGVPCRELAEADRLFNILNRAVVVAAQSGLVPYKWSALVTRAIDCAPESERDGLYQLRYDHSLSVSNYARRQVLVDWARDAMARGQDKQARRAYAEAMELLDSRPVKPNADRNVNTLIPPEDAVAMARLGMVVPANRLAQAHVTFIVNRPKLGDGASRAAQGSYTFASLQTALMLLDLGNDALLSRLGIHMTPTVIGSDPTVLRGNWFAAQIGMRYLKETEEHSRQVRVGRQILPQVAASGDFIATMVINLLVAEASAELGDFELAETHLTDVQRIAALNNVRPMVENRVLEVQDRLAVFRLANLPVAEQLVQQLTTYYGNDCKGAPHRAGATDWPFPKIDFYNFSTAPDFRTVILNSDVMDTLSKCIPSEKKGSVTIRKLQKHQARMFCAIAAIHGRADLVTSVLKSKDAAVPDITSSIWCIYGLTDVGIVSWVDRAGFANGTSDSEILYNMMIATPQVRRSVLSSLNPNALPQTGLNSTPWADLALARAPALRQKLLADVRQSFLGSHGNIGPQAEDFEDAYLAGVALRKLGLYNIAEAVFYLDDRIDPFNFGFEDTESLTADLLDIPSVQKRLDYARLYRSSGQFDRARAAISPIVELAVARLSSTENPLPGTVEQWSERLADAFHLYLTLQFDPNSQAPNYQSIFLVQQFIQAARSTASLSVLEQRLNSSAPDAARAYQDSQRILRAVMRDPNAEPRAIEEATQRLRTAEEELERSDGALQGHQIGVIRPLEDAVASLVPGEAMLVVTQLEEAMIQTILTATTAQARRVDVQRYDATQQVRRFRESVTQSTVEVDRFDTRAARDLYDYMVGWALGRVVPSRLKIVADSPWATLPYGALKTGDGWLAQTTALQLSPSVARSVLSAASTSRGVAKRGFVGFGDPIMTNYANRPGVTAQGMLAPLPETKPELDFLAALFGDRSHQEVYTRASATEAQIRALNADNRLQSSRILALATHGLLSSDAVGVGDAALVLSDPTQPDTDGFLSSSEIYTYRIGAELVILSACNTGTPNAGNGISDLASAFFYAGAQRLMLTHWEIESGAALEMLKHFAPNFSQAGAVPDDSLRSAINAILTNPRLQRYHHPRYWAAHFIIS